MKKEEPHGSSFVLSQNVSVPIHQQLHRRAVAGKPLHRQGAGVGAGIGHRHQIADLQRRAGEALLQNIQCAAEVAHQMHRLRAGGIAQRRDGAGVLPGKQRLLGRDHRIRPHRTAQHGGDSGLLEAVEAVLHDDVGHAPGGLFVHHRHEICTGLTGQEPAGLDEQAGSQRAAVLLRNVLGALPQSGVVQRLLGRLVVGDAHAAAEVDVLHGAAQHLLHPQRQREAVLIVPGQHGGVQILGAQMDVDTADRDGQSLQRRAQLGQILLADAELAGGAGAAVHIEAGVDPHADGPHLPLLRGDAADAHRLADGVGDQVAVIPRLPQGAVGLAGGGKVDVGGGHAALLRQQHLPGGGGVRADAQRRQRPHHRRERVGLHGKQEIKAGERIAQQGSLPRQYIAGVDKAGGVFPRQTQNMLVHGRCSFRCIVIRSV